MFVFGTIRVLLKTTKKCHSCVHLAGISTFATYLLLYNRYSDIMGLIGTNWDKKRRNRTKWDKMGLEKRDKYM